MSYPERLAGKIKRQLEEAAAQSSEADWTTSFLLKHLCKLGHCEGLLVYASNCEGADGGEWLYDMCWLDYGEMYEDGSNRKFFDTVLVVESEWSTKDGDLEDDFEKLVQARSGLRVMVFQAQTKSKAIDTIQRLFVRDIKAYRRGQPDDTHLFCAYLAPNDKVFRHWIVRNTYPWEVIELY